MPNNKIIVKVGKKSALQFRSSYTYRAVTVTEIQSLVEEFKDIDIIIIESITEREYEPACKVLSKYIEDSKNHVFFFTPNNDVVTTGLADALDLDIYMDEKELYKAIKLNCNIDVSPDISIKRDEVNNFDEADEDPFNNDFDKITNAISEVSKSISSELPVIRSKLDIKEFSRVQITGENIEHIAPESNNDENVSIYNINNNPELEESIADETTVDKSKFDELQRLLEEANSSIDSLKNKINTEIENNDKLTSRILELNKIIEAVKDERDAIQDEFYKIEVSNIIEDPETIDELNRIRSDNAELLEKISNQSSMTSEEVNSLKHQLDEANTARSDLEDKNASFEIKIAELEQSLANALNDSSKDLKIEELLSQVKELSEDIDALKSQLDESKQIIESNKDTISELTEQMKAERSSKIMLSDIVKNSKEKLDESKDLREQVAFLTKSKSEIESDLEQANAELEDNRILVSKLKSETEARIELARNFAKDELSTVKNENIKIKAQLEIVSNRLAAKDAQYNSLVRSAGIDENGAVTILESNKTLEAVNNQLRISLNEYKSAYERSNRETAEIKQALESVKDQKSKLAIQLKAMTTGFTGTSNIGIIPPISYSGRGTIISIFGSGSYGITTTAMSSAIRLSNNSRVLYIDFDMVSAKADGWFNINPIIQGLPNMCQKQEMNTALGLLLEKGAPYIAQYANSIFKRAITLKNGFCDYASGLYTNPDIVKFVSADLSTFLTYCGNIYDYIIIDFGRLGASDINNQIIKVFSDVSYKSIVVSSSDKFDIRNTRLKLQSIGINMNKVSWIVNLANSTKLDDKSKSHIAPAPFLIMPFVDDFYGQKKDFTKDRISKDKFNMFIEKMVIKI